MYGSLKADAVNRIAHEVRRARKEFKSLGYTESDIIDDDEVRPEIENLVRIIIEELNEENDVRI